MPAKEIPEGVTEVKVVGPYSPVVRIGNHFHFSGVIPDLSHAGDPTLTQAREVLNKMHDLLAACGLGFGDVYSVTIMFAVNMDAFPEVNKAYADVFTGVEIMPRRAAFAVAALPFGVKIEIVFDAVKQD